MLTVLLQTAGTRMISRRRFIARMAILLAAANDVPAFAQNDGDYPVRPIHFIIPNTSGGTSDILARLIGARLSDALGQPVVVESRPGAAGRIALDYMANAAPDGYTILLGNNGTNAIVPIAQVSDVVDETALVPVIKLASLAIVVAATPKLGVSSLRDVIERARQPAGFARLRQQRHRIDFAHGGCAAESARRHQAAADPVCGNGVRSQGRARLAKCR